MQQSQRFEGNPFDAYFVSSVCTEEQRPGPRHYHDGFELLYIIEGSHKVHIRNAWYTGTAGDLLIYYPGESHEDYSLPGTIRFICLRFLNEYLDKSLDFPQLEPVFHLSGIDEFRAIFEKMVIESHASDEYSKSMVGSYLVQFVILLWRALKRFQNNLPTAKGLQHNRITQILGSINNSIESDISLKELAHKSFLSESRYSHLFKDVTGTSPKQYIIRSKLQKAHDLITTTSLTIVEICKIAGYDNPAYFSRLFKQKYGCSPNSLRKKTTS